MIEIERKFKTTRMDVANLLVDLKGTRIRQTYMLGNETMSVRVRSHQQLPDGEFKHEITAKSLINSSSMSRTEETSPISVYLASMIHRSDLPSVMKTRYKVAYGKDNLFWEIDVFDGPCLGLVIIEIELPSEDYPLEIPEWFGGEVTHNSAYLNQNLAAKPRTV